MRRRYSAFTPAVSWLPVSLLWVFGGCFASGCAPELGQAPFRCHTGTPHCPEGYVCTLPGDVARGVCVRAGSCPAGLAGCDPLCGDGECKDGETCDSCESDCGPCETSCGDGTCGSREDCATCPVDCSPCPAVCGDGTCGLVESCSTCAADCGVCAGRCGDGSCGASENCSSCTRDCGPCGATCGDGRCDPGENDVSCPADCQAVCQAGQTKCDSKDKLGTCENGAWKTADCSTVCTQRGFAVALECRVDAGKADCQCESGGGFGDICSANARCETSLVCLKETPSAAQGFCSKACNNPFGVCKGAGPLQQALCISTHEGAPACAFVCALMLCPSGLHCDPAELVCRVSPTP